MVQGFLEKIDEKVFSTEKIQGILGKETLNNELELFLTNLSYLSDDLNITELLKEYCAGEKDGRLIHNYIKENISPLVEKRKRPRFV